MSNPPVDNFGLAEWGFDMETGPTEAEHRAEYLLDVPDATQEQVDEDVAEWVEDVGPFRGPRPGFWDF